MNKKYIRYGLEFTSFEFMVFSKFMDNEGIAMNTKKPEERTKLAKDWLENYKSK